MGSIRNFTPKLKKIPSFPIVLQWYEQQLTDLNILGAHGNFVVNANNLEIARFLDQGSAIEYIKFLQQSHFKVFLTSAQGEKLLEVLYANHCGVKLDKVDTNSKGHIITEDIKTKNFLT